jgi:two-component system response regulator AtoC
METKMKIDMIGVSPNITKIRKLIDQVADTDLNIVVSGETGVGKEVVVRSLYEKSKRCAKPFVKVNCAALPDTLLESEMFGYESGAFTGAQKKMRGKFEQADGGILFLDEIGDMPLALQSKLLHVLQDGDFTPLGSEKLISTDVWVIAATNHNLEDDIEKGNFRADMYHRLNSMEIYIEPLRSRPEDIPPLIDYYYEIYASQSKEKQLRTLSKSTADKLTAYHWPGNVRELQNVLKRIFILGEKEETIDMLINTKNTQTLSDTPKNLIDLPIVKYEKEPQLSSLSLKDIKRKVMDRIEKEVISYVLMKSDWNRSQAARILNISYKSILNKIQDLNIKIGPESANKVIEFPKYRIDGMVTTALNKIKINAPNTISGKLPETLTAD